MVTAYIDPVFCGCEQEATQDGPAKAVKHLVRMPLSRIDPGFRQAQATMQAEYPEDRQHHAGENGQAEKGAETHQPEWVLR